MVDKMPVDIYTDEHGVEHRFDFTHITVPEEVGNGSASVLEKIGSKGDGANGGYFVANTGQIISKEKAAKAVETGDAKDAMHYQFARLQPIEVMQMFLSPERFIGMCQGTSMKYLMRMGHKDDELKDARKARQYVTWMVEAMEGKTIDPRK